MENLKAQKKMLEVNKRVAAGTGKVIKKDGTPLTQEEREQNAIFDIRNVTASVEKAQAAEKKAAEDFEKIRVEKETSKEKCNEALDELCSLMQKKKLNEQLYKESESLLKKYEECDSEKVKYNERCDKLKAELNNYKRSKRDSAPSISEVDIYGRVAAKLKEFDSRKEGAIWWAHTNSDEYNRMIGEVKKAYDHASSEDAYSLEDLKGHLHDLRTACYDYLKRKTEGFHWGTKQRHVRLQYAREMVEWVNSTMEMVEKASPRHPENRFVPKIVGNDRTVDETDYDAEIIQERYYEDTALDLNKIKSAVITEEKIDKREKNVGVDQLENNMNISAKSAEVERLRAEVIKDSSFWGHIKNFFTRKNTQNVKNELENATKDLEKCIEKQMKIGSKISDLERQKYYMRSSHEAFDQMEKENAQYANKQRGKNIKLGQEEPKVAEVSQEPKNKNIIPILPS